MGNRKQEAAAEKECRWHSNLDQLVKEKITREMTRAGQAKIWEKIAQGVKIVSEKASSKA